MSTPIYQTAADRAAEDEIGALVGQHFKVKTERMPDFHPYDFKLHYSDGPFGALECKSRTRYLWGELRMRGTYMMSKHKWDKLLPLCEAERLGLCLAVMDKAGEVWAACWRYPDWPAVEFGMGGRLDNAGDWEPCVYIPTDHFSVLIRDRLEKPKPMGKGAGHW